MSDLPGNLCSRCSRSLVLPFTFSEFAGCVTHVHGKPPRTTLVPSFINRRENLCFPCYRSMVREYLRHPPIPFRGEPCKA